MGIWDRIKSKKTIGRVLQMSELSCTSNGSPKDITVNIRDKHGKPGFIYFPTLPPITEGREYVFTTKTPFFAGLRRLFLKPRNLYDRYGSSWALYGREVRLKDSENSEISPENSEKDL